MSGHWLGRVAAAGLLLAAAALNQSAVHWRDDIADDQLFAYHGWQLAQGARPYLDFWDNKPPGIFWVNALAMRLDAESPAGVLLMCSAALLGGMAAAAGVTRQVYGAAWTWPGIAAAAALLSQLQFECGADRTETFVLALEAIGVWAYLRRVRGGGRAWMFCAAFALGAAPLFKQSGIAALLACVLHALWLWMRGGIRWSGRGAAVVSAGGLLPGLAALAALSGPGQLSAAWQAIVVFNRAYFAVEDATFTRLGDALRIYSPALPALTPLLALALLGALIGAIRGLWRRCAPAGAPEDRARGGLLLIWSWLLIAAYLALVGPGRREYHLAPLLAPLAVLTVWPLVALAGPIAGGLAARWLARPSLLGVMLLWVVVVSGPLLSTVGLAERFWARKASWWGLQRAAATDDELRAARLRALTGPAQTVYVFGWGPGTYRHALRRCASRFATTEKVGQVGRHAGFILDGVAADLSAAPPAAFFVSPGDWENMAQGRLAALRRQLGGQFVKQDTIGGMLLFVRSDGRQPGG